MDIRVVGNKDSIQSDVDFYLQLTSSKGIGSIESYRKEMFSKFKRDSEMAYRSMSVGHCINLEDESEVLEEGKINLDNESELVSSDNNIEYVEHGVFLDRGIDDEVYLEDENDSLENGNDEYVESSGSYIDEENILENKNYGCNDDGDVYIEEGVDLEDRSGIEDVSEEEYVYHGIYLDNENDNLEEGNTLLSSEEGDEEVDSEDETWGYEEDLEESGYTVENEDDSWGYSEEDDSLCDEVFEEEVIEDNNWGCEEEIEEAGDNDTSEEQETGFIADFIEELNEVIPDAKKEEDIEVPKDIRSFLKMYPNSEISFVKKYFSEKEINKQLKLGRVFRRNGKLSI